MTSEQRREARYQRRKRKRDLKRMRRAYACGRLEDVFTFRSLYKTAKKAYRGVNWKSSTQIYRSNSVSELWDSKTKVLSGSYRSKGFVEFDILERGKKRHIRSVHISERIIQKCLCDYVLTPCFSPTLIYDNGASTSGKGIHFALNRLTCHLQRHYRKYGTEGYALLFDFSKYFDTASHVPIFEAIDRNVADEEVNRQTKYFIDQFGDFGLGLGSQISQLAALVLPNSLDHIIKEKLRIKGYARYMDDGYLLHPSKEYLETCLLVIEEECKKLGITLNKKKTRIVPIKRGFRFLKVKFTLTDTGKVVRKIDRKSVIRMGRKLKTFRRWYEEGKMTMEDIWASYQSWRGYVKHCDCWHTIRRMDAKYKELFEGGMT